MTQRAALYARVSTAHQEREQTIASQLKALDTAATDAGFVVDDAHRYIDEGYSGARLDRPALDRLRDAAAEGQLDVVLIHCPDRLARNFVHQQILIEELQKRGVTVHFIERPIGEKPEDRLLVQMQGVIAEYERAKIVERTRRGRLHKVKTGQVLPFTMPPYGYAIVRSPEAPQGVVVIDEAQAVHVRAMYHWASDEDLSLLAIARRLNALGVPSRDSPSWGTTTVYRVLLNPVYTGHAYYGKSEAVPPPQTAADRWLRWLSESGQLRARAQAARAVARAGRARDRGRGAGAAGTRGAGASPALDLSQRAPRVPVTRTGDVWPLRLEHGRNPSQHPGKVRLPLLYVPGPQAARMHVPGDTMHLGKCSHRAA